MTRSENMEHVEVLWELRDRAAMNVRSAQGAAESERPRARVAALDAAIAALSAQQPAAVDGAMVERMAQAVATELYGEPPPPGSNSLTRAMMLPCIKRALTAALAGQQGGAK